MAGTLAPPKPSRAATSSVSTLGVDDIPTLRLPGLRGSQCLQRALEHYPGRSVWMPATLEYAHLNPWRNRREIAHVAELVAVGQAEALLRAAFERCVACGDDLMLAIELETQRGPTRYERAGMELLEEVITYEADAPRQPWSPRRGVRLVPVGAGDDRTIDLVTRIDAASFPWLWRNNREEFGVYLRTPGVDVSLLEADGEPVGYVGTTHFAGWSHLDRIAIAPDVQGRGFGREALGLAVEGMRRQGARRVGLSTQRTNVRSQRLYERFGFWRTPEMDYRLFGAWCRSDHVRRPPGAT